MKVATVFAPGSVGNVGPGFDILGLAIDGIGDRVTVELGKTGPVIVRGVDAELVPTDPARNAAAIAASALLSKQPFQVTIEKGIPVSAGLGGSASSSVAGAYAAALASGDPVTREDIMLCALEGEIAVSGRHLDNIAPITMGGLVLSRSIDPIDVIPLPAPQNWSIALITPRVRIETKQARAILPQKWERESWIQQMANTSALIVAFSTGDGALARRALDDLYAEPRRAPMIPHFADVKRTALEAGAFGCSISGSGPTIFAIVDASTSRNCAEAMRRAMGDVPCEVRVAGIARQG
ncbi:MAG TPA: homoserine kinase, partial [Thermoanaerobaculia bacterium]